MKKATILSLMIISLTVGSLSLAQTSELACLKDLCGSENPYAHPFEKSPELRVAAVQAVDQEVKKTLAQYIGRVIHRGLLEDALFKQLIAQKTKISLRPELTAYIQTFRYQKLFGKISEAAEIDSNGKLFINPKELKKVMPHFSQAEIEAVVSLKDALNFESGIFENPLEVVLKAFHPTMTVAQAQMYEAQAIIKTENEMAAMVPLSLAFSRVGVLVQRAAAGSILTDSEKNILKDKIRRRMLMNLVMAPEVQEKFAKIPLDVEQVINEFSQSYPKSLQAQAIQNPKSIRSLFQKTMKNCTGQLAEAYGSHPTSAQKENFRLAFDQLRKTSSLLLRERYPIKYMDDMKIELILPSDREKFLPELNANLKATIATWDEQVRAIKKYDINDPAVAEAIFDIASSFSSEDLLTEVNDLCDQSQPPFMTDAALSQHKIVNISWPTIVNPEVGLGIVAHELGHVASSIYSSGFRKERSCLLDKQKSSQYREEDFADLFATEVSRRLKFQVGSIKLGNFICPLLPREKNAWATGNELSNSNPDASHSSHFYRLMATASQTTGIPSSCVSHLKAKSETRFESYCRWGQ